MQKAGFFIAVDSGFSHLAKAMHRRCILLIGKLRNFSGHMPLQLDPNDIVLRSMDGVLSISVEDVVSAVKQI
jgi:ADP-heptose:LPS heptosyltransferase